MKSLAFSLLLTGSLWAAKLPEGYELGEDTASPDGRYALLYPAPATGNEPPNLLVQLEPYKVLAEIRPGVPQGATMEVAATWHGNDLVAVHQSRRWGLAGLWVYELDGDRVRRVHPVLDAVRPVFQKDFQERVRKNHPDEAETIIFVSGEEENPAPEFAFKDRKVLLNLFADNKPNLAPGVHWQAALKAAWNLDTGQLEDIALTPGKVETRKE